MITPILKPKEAEGRKSEPSDKEKRLLLGEMYFSQNGCCYLCGCRMTREPGLMVTAVIEHVKPGKMGGCKDWSRENLKAACWHCNSLKGSRRDYVG